MNYYISKSGSVEGPLAEVQLREQMSREEITAATPCCPEGQTQWSTVGVVLGLVPPPPPPPQPSPQEPANAAPALSVLCVSSLIAGIVLLVPALMRWYLVPCLLVPAILGHLGRAAIKRSQGRLTGRTMALTGLVLGYVGLGVAGAVAIGVLTRTTEYERQVRNRETQLRRERKDQLSKEAEDFYRQMEAEASESKPAPQAVPGSKPAAPSAPKVDIEAQTRLKAECDRTKFNIGVLATYFEEFRKDVGRYATTQEGLQSLRSSKAKGWRGPYINQDYLADAWGRAYEYRRPGLRHPEGYDLRSPGPDGVLGTPDDLTN